MTRSTRLVAASAAALLVIVVAWVAVGGNGSTRLSATVLQTGLSVPWDVAFAPGGQMLVTERPGRIVVFGSSSPGAAVLSTMELPDVRAEGEAGAMGIAVVPDAPSDPRVYVCVSRDPDGAAGEDPWLNQVLGYRLRSDGTLSYQGVVFDGGMRAHVHHNGCALEAAPDGMLWLTMGDANTGSGANLAQDPNSLNGKVLRITRDGQVPQGNPVLPGAEERTAAWSMGHRNPQGLVVGPADRVIVAEHGTDTNDELNLIVAGGNYGYGCVTGMEADGPATTWCEGTDPSAFKAPMWASGSPTLATSGAALLQGELWGDLAGDLVVTTLKEADLRRFEVSGDGTARLVETLLDDAHGRLRAAVIGPDGALYLTTSNDDGNDAILRVVPAE